MRRFLQSKIYMNRHKASFTVSTNEIKNSDEMARAIQRKHPVVNSNLPAKQSWENKTLSQSPYSNHRHILLLVKLHATT